MNEWTHERTNERTNERMSEWINEWVNELRGKNESHPVTLESSTYMGRVG